MADRVFAVPIFFICFRESLEAAIIVSVLLTVVKQTLGSDQSVYKKLVKQVWWGVASAFLICLAIGGAMIGVWYRFGSNHFAVTENIWEGVFGLLASLIITVMGAALLRVSKLQDKWRVKIARAIEDKDAKTAAANGAGGRFRQWCERYAMFILPFITVLREGLEAVIFIGGVGLSLPASSFPLAIFCGFLAGILIGWLIYRGGNTARMQVFLIVSTCFLYLVAAGLFSKAVWYFEANAWAKVIGGDSDDLSSGPGSYDIRKSVWHVNCCNAEDKSNGGGGWGIFNALFGWQNSATYGSVISYNLYWLAVIVAFLLMHYQERNGHLPFMKAKAKSVAGDSSEDEQIGSVIVEKKADTQQPATTTAVREIEG